MDKGGEVRWPFNGNGGSTEIVRAEGAWLHKSDGTRILDAAGGAIVTNIGHGREEVADAVRDATLNNTYVVPVWLTPERRRLAERLTAEWLPPALTRQHFTSGGSEGNETAMKLAIQYQAAVGRPEKCKIIGRSVSYHGTTLATTAVGGHEARKSGLKHALASHPRVPTPYPLHCDAGDEAAHSAGHYLRDLEHTIEQEGADTIAAVMAEPITGASGGAIVPPPGYWEGVREICDRHDILILQDEVMTGFGRTGAKFGFQHWDFVPDVVVGGKGLGGGYAPITGVFATERIGEALDDAGMMVMFHTFGAHAAACAAADRVLDILLRENLVERAATLGEELGKRLAAAFSNHPHVAEVRGRGMLQAIEVVQDRDTLTPFPAEDHIASRIMAAGLERGVFFYAGGTGVVRDIVVLGPPLIIDEEEMGLIVETLVAAVDDVTLGPAT